jgi:hypothetical protein
MANLQGPYFPIHDNCGHKLRRALQIAESHAVADAQPALRMRRNEKSADKPGEGRSPRTTAIALRPKGRVWNFCREWGWWESRLNPFG